MNEFESALGAYLSEEQLARVRSIKVGVFGAGGLGSNCAMALVRAGFRRIRIVDDDVVEPSNLNRQFYFLAQSGRTKVEALKENLLLINPDAEIEIDAVRVTPANAAALFADRDVVVEAFDGVESKKLVVETYLHSNKFLVAASGLAGFGDSDRIKVNRIRENFHIVGDLATGVGPNAPPLAPCVLVAAAKQADLVLSHALGDQ